MKPLAPPYPYIMGPKPLFQQCLGGRFMNFL